MIPKKKAKLVVKDAYGSLVQITPEVCVDGKIAADGTNPVANSAVAAAFNELASKGSAVPKVKVAEEEPTLQNTADLSSKSLIAWLQPETESWSVTIDTEAASQGSRMGEVPFCLHGIADASFLVDWGDGTVERYSTEDFPALECPKHEYEAAGVYAVKIESSDFRKMHLWAASAYDPIFAYILKSVDSPLPAIAGTRCWYWEEGMSGDGYIMNVDGMMYGCFEDCSSLESIPLGLFDRNPDTTSFERCFYGCQSLASIPSGLFDCCTDAVSFNDCFADCQSLASIPSGLFDENLSAVRFDYCFRNCASLELIPPNLFSNHSAATSFYECFDACESLKSVPAGLFSGCTAAENFYGCFFACSALISISPSAFSGCTGAKWFEDCFFYCQSLTSIPSDLFKDCTNATTFDECFSACYALASIPENLFASNSAALTFEECFRSCQSLASIPENLFANNVAATSFESCFRYCTSLGDFSVRIGSPSVSNASGFANKVSGAQRTVYVPAGSTTYSTFNASASSLGLSIVQE